MWEGEVVDDGVTFKNSNEIFSKIVDPFIERCALVHQPSEINNHNPTTRFISYWLFKNPKQWNKNNNRNSFDDECIFKHR